jgi:hypothetical protein
MGECSWAYQRVGGNQCTKDTKERAWVHWSARPGKHSACADKQKGPKTLPLRALCC